MGRALPFGVDFDTIRFDKPSLCGLWRLEIYMHGRWANCEAHIDHCTEVVEEMTHHLTSLREPVLGGAGIDLNRVGCLVRLHQLEALTWSVPSTDFITWDGRNIRDSRAEYGAITVFGYRKEFVFPHTERLLAQVFDDFGLKPMIKFLDEERYPWREWGAAKSRWPLEQE